MMRTASEILDLARKDSRYLGQFPYLCTMLACLVGERRITHEERCLAVTAIKVSIKNATFLRTFLRVNRLIESYADERSAEYAPAAHKHWDNVIAVLQEQGY